jgi:hypothetical protein
MVARGFAVVVGLSACNALTGANDFGFGDSPGDVLPERTENPTVPPEGDAASVAPPGSGPSVASRIKDITFEDKALTHPKSGYESVNGQMLLETATPIAGSASAFGMFGAFGAQPFPPEPVLFVSASVRFEALLPPARILALQLEGGGTLDVFVTRQSGEDYFQVRANGNVSSGGPQVAMGGTYRFGLRYRAQAGDVTVYRATAGAAFGAGATLTTGTAGRKAVGVQVGVLEGTGTVAVFDDVRLDRSAMP